MTEDERDRLSVFSRVKDKQMSLIEAGQQLEISYRQARRLFKRYKQLGDAALVHGLRGRPSNNHRPVNSRRAKAISLYKERYENFGFGPTLASQRMEMENKLTVHPETLRGWLIGEGLWKPGRKRKERHRSRRPRKPWFGQLVQFDGSDHAWFGPDYPRCCLMVMIDDATSRVLAKFFDSETTLAAMEIFYNWVDLYGLPRELYPDKHSIHRCNDKSSDEKEHRSGKRPLTRFGQAMSDLKVKLIHAGSPQAKGRVERANGTFQDRLVKQMRLDGITAIGQGNDYLQNYYLEDHNKRFGANTDKFLDVHRACPSGNQLREALCVKEARSVGKDGCVRFKGRWFQLLGKDNIPRRLRDGVQVRKHIDGTLELWALGRSLEYKELENHEKKR